MNSLRRTMFLLNKGGQFLVSGTFIKLLSTRHDYSFVKQTGVVFIVGRDIFKTLGNLDWLTVWTVL